MSLIIHYVWYVYLIFFYFNNYNVVLCNINVPKQNSNLSNYLRSLHSSRDEEQPMGTSLLSSHLQILIFSELKSCTSNNIDSITFVKVIYQISHFWRHWKLDTAFFPHIEGHSPTPVNIIWIVAFSFSTQII